MGNWYQTDDVVITIMQAPLGDGQATTNSSSVDMQGFDGVLLIGSIGTITGAGTVSMTGEQSENDSSFASLPTAVANAVAADDDQLMVVDILRPAERYIRTALIRAAGNSVYNGTIAIRYKAKAKPTTQETASIIAAGITQVTTPSE